MATKQLLEAKNPLILRCNRLMEAFAKSDDERDFYLDKQEGFIVYADLDKPDEDLTHLEKELEKNHDRYSMIPKLTFYETKKIMEGFINEKVYDIDTKEKLLDIIQSKEARDNFLDFIYDHHAELEKWQTYYQERSRIRIIEWLRTNNIHFVFEEDLEIPRLLLEKLKKELFESKVGKDIANARKTLFAKAKTYYSTEALNPRPKRGRPPKQAQKVEVEPQFTSDIFTTVPNGLRCFLFTPDAPGSTSSSFSSKLSGEGDLFTPRRSTLADIDVNMGTLNQKLEALRSLSSKWKEEEVKPKQFTAPSAPASREKIEVQHKESNSQPKKQKAPPKKIATKNKEKTKLQKPVTLKSKAGANGAKRATTRIVPKKKAATKPTTKKPEKKSLSSSVKKL